MFIMIDADGYYYRYSSARRHVYAMMMTPTRYSMLMMLPSARYDDDVAMLPICRYMMSMRAMLFVYAPYLMSTLPFVARPIF